MRKIDRVALGLSAFSAAAVLVFPFLSLRVTRLSQADGVSLLSALGPGRSFVLVGCLLLLALAGVAFRPGRSGAWAVAGSGMVTALLALWFAGEAAGRLATGLPFARVSLSAGAWVLLVSMLAASRTSRHHLPRGTFGRALMAGMPLLLFLPFLFGKLDSLSFMVEFVNRSGRFLLEFRRHLLLCTASVVTGSLVGIPLGYASTRVASLGGPVLAFAGTLQTFPSLALFGLLIAPLAYAADKVPFLKGLGVGGIGWAPAFVALSLYSLLPIIRNTFEGFESLQADMLDAANGMGMSRTQRLFRVEVPVAAPIVLGGVRVAAVQAVGNTAVAALIGAGGLGTFIFQGLGEAAPDLVLLGALPILLVAVLADGLLDALIRLLTPRGLREGSG